MIRTGPRNLITDVPGLTVGNAEDTDLRSGVTVLLPDEPAVCAVDTRGGGPGTRETDALDPSCVVDRVHAVVLSGGSAFGLDAASGVMAWLRERRRGFRMGDVRVPIVPAAVLFDLLNGGDKGWQGVSPYPSLARQAADAAAADFRLGNAGAGMGAKAGRLKGGLGSASFVYEGQGRGSDFTVGALAAANPLGSPLIPGTTIFWAWPFEQDGELGGQERPAVGAIAPDALDHPFDLPAGTNTTLAVVATDLELTKAQAGRVAIMAHDGFGRALRPVHTPLDGDCVFVVSTGRRPIRDPIADLARLGMLAADCVARAVARGVYEAESLGDFPGYRSLLAARDGVLEPRTTGTATGRKAS